MLRTLEALSPNRGCACGLQVFESSGDGSLTHPGVLKDRVASPAGVVASGHRPKPCHAALVIIGDSKWRAAVTHG